MKTEIKKGDWVSVQDQGLLMLQKLMPKQKVPNNVGIVSDILKNGNLEILFPIGKDDMEKHSQVSMYQANICIKTEPPKVHANYKLPANKP